jgi:superfamily II DNA/RNA helicase
MLFKNLGLHPDILKAIEEMKYSIPTPIQNKAIPAILSGSDVCGSAQTGTGKTAAFLLPAIHQMMTRAAKPGHGPRILILVPTRELAMQIAGEAAKYMKHLPKMKTVCIFGGAPYPVQIRQLQANHEILVATPGRLIDHMERGRVDFSRVELFVLDEADRMLDMGFIQPVQQIAARIAKPRQVLLFCATMQSNVLKLAKGLLQNPTEIHISSPKTKHENIEQKLYFVKSLDEKYSFLETFLADPVLKQAIVFTATKRQTKQLHRHLRDSGHDAGELHGDMNQSARTRTIGLVRQGKIRVLVATDVAARGIDVQNISHVINFDIAACAEDHVHRVGRTGRASERGIALCLVSRRDMHLVREIEKYTGQKMVLQNPQEVGTFSPQEKRVPQKARPFHRSGTYGARQRTQSDSQHGPFQHDSQRGAASDSQRGPFQHGSQRGASSDSQHGPFQHDSQRGAASDSQRGPFQHGSQRGASSDSQRGAFQHDSQRGASSDSQRGASYGPERRTQSDSQRGPAQPGFQRRKKIGGRPGFPKRRSWTNR